jgi:hypothetical protein
VYNLDRVHPILVRSSLDILLGREEKGFVVFNTAYDLQMAQMSGTGTSIPWG